MDTKIKAQEKGNQKVSDNKKNLNYYKDTVLDPAQRLANAIIASKKNGVKPH